MKSKSREKPDATTILLGTITKQIVEVCQARAGEGCTDTTALKTPGNVNGRISQKIRTRTDGVEDGVQVII